LRVVLDEDVPRKIVPFLPAHEVHSVVSLRWGGIKNGTLLDLIDREGFDVFITGDKNMSSQQQLENRPFAVLILSAINWPIVRPYVEKIASAVATAQPGTVTLVECGLFLRGSKSETNL
jgi:hypothetical protein